MDSVSGCSSARSRITVCMDLGLLQKKNSILSIQFICGFFCCLFCCVIRQIKLRFNNVLPFADEHSVAMSRTDFWNPTTVIFFPLMNSAAVSKSMAAYSIECITFPRNASGPFPAGYSGIFGTSLYCPTHRITKSTW